MKPARLAVLAVALLTGGAAAYMISSGEPSAPVVQAAPSKTTDVLVAGIDLPMGHGIRGPDLRWQPWPADSLPTGLLKRSDAPDALDQTVGSITRVSIFAGEPIRREKLVKVDGTGFMSAILPSGMRAVAISIDSRGSSSAGGFILPNDRVDVLRTYRDEEAARAGTADVFKTETILPNVRVLAIGQNVQERNGEKVVTGETATLELTPPQAEVVTLAQKVGQLSLALRSLADANEPQEVREERPEGAMTIVRYGVSRQAPK